MQPHRGAMILTLGILSLIFCQLLGIVPWVLASSDLRAMSEGSMDAEGRGLTEAGRICGMIAVALAVVGLLAGVVFFAFAFLFAAGSSGSAFPYEIR